MSATILPFPSLHPRFMAELAQTVSKGWVEHDLAMSRVAVEIMDQDRGAPRGTGTGLAQRSQ
jgi:hypothetical protein